MQLTGSAISCLSHHTAYSTHASYELTIPNRFDIDGCLEEMSLEAITGSSATTIALGATVVLDSTPHSLTTVPVHV